MEMDGRWNTHIGLWFLTQMLVTQAVIATVLIAGGWNAQTGTHRH